MTRNKVVAAEINIMQQTTCSGRKTWSGCRGSVVASPAPDPTGPSAFLLIHYGGMKYGFLPLTYKDNIFPSFIGTFDFLCDVLIFKILFSKIHKTKVNFSKFANHYSYFCRCLDKHNIIVCRDVCSSLWMYVAHW